MRKILTALAPLLLSGAALAADLPRAPAYAPAIQPYDAWSGLYLGLNVGGGWAKGSSDFAVAGGPAATASNPLSGVLGGGQVGYNWHSGPILFGAEADFQASNVTGSLTTPCVPVLCGLPLGASFSQTVAWFGTARGRLGFATDSWVIYATGGYAYARLDTEANATAGPFTAAFSQSELRGGFAAGAGIDVALAARWSARLEYLYLDFGSHSTNLTVPGVPPITDTARLNMNVARAAVNYRF